jgi:long-chain acyl-CoA synthetase
MHDLLRSDQPQTINQLILKATAQRGDQITIRHKRDKVWREITGTQLITRIANLTVGLHQLGVKKGDRVAILADSCPEWSITDYAILACGAVTVPIYPTQAIDQVAQILENCGAEFLFLGNSKNLKRIQPVLDQMKKAPQLFFLDEKSEDLPNLPALENQGGAEIARQPQLFGVLISEAVPDDLATIIYTSGTTGEPKGVMLTHRNLVFDALSAGQWLGPSPEDIFLSFLPLSHIFERTVMYLLMHHGVQLCYARGIETVSEDMKEVHPTIVTGVPRLFEKIYATIIKRAADAPPMKQRIFHQAVKVGREVAILRDQRQSVPLSLKIQLSVLDRLVFSKWREAVGGKIRYFFCRRNDNFAGLWTDRNFSGGRGQSA